VKSPETSKSKISSRLINYKLGYPSLDLAVTILFLHLTKCPFFVEFHQKWLSPLGLVIQPCPIWSTLPKWAISVAAHCIWFTMILYNKLWWQKNCMDILCKFLISRISSTELPINTTILFLTWFWCAALFLPLRENVVEHSASEDAQDGSLNRQPGVNQVERWLELGSSHLEVDDHRRKGGEAASRPVLGQGIARSRVLLGHVRPVLLKCGPTVTVRHLTFQWQFKVLKPETANLTCFDWLVVASNRRRD